MRLSVFLVFITFNLFAGIDCSQAQPDNAQSHIPQAEPVISWLMAAKEGDEKRLKTVFSERMRKKFDEEGWDKVLKTYQQVFEKEFGDYRLEDFAFEYSGGENEGRVSIVYREEKLPGVQVIKEKGNWKVDER